MNLSFKKKKKGTKPIYIILSVLALLITATLLTIWLIIGYHRSVPTPEENGETTASTYEEPISGVANCLVILKMENHAKFVLVQTNPQDKCISAVPIPAIIANKNGTTLSHLYKAGGADRIIQVLEDALQLPVDHHITVDAVGINKFLSDLDQGITIKLPQNISYTDENGLSSTIRSGKRQLTASQAVAVLEYTGWDTGDYEERVAADMIASLLNQYLVTDRSIRGYFGALANVAQTDLRIDNYNTYSSALVLLAENNSGSICSIITLEGKIKGGFFVPDPDAMRLKSNLYSHIKEDDV